MMQIGNFNSAGGLKGRKIEPIVRDSRATR